MIVKKPKKYSEADWLLLDTIRQSLTKRFNEETKEDYYDAEFKRNYCEALYYLCEIGMLQPTIGSQDWDGFYRTFCAKEFEPEVGRTE